MYTGKNRAHSVHRLITKATLSGHTHTHTHTREEATLTQFVQTL